MNTANGNSDSPSLHKSFVCYADILGSRARTLQAFETGQETDFLKRIKRSLSIAYDQVRQIQEILGSAGEGFDMKVFTDNIVVSYKAQHLEIERGERELGTFLMLFAQVQAGLASDGFLLRGAISFGNHFQDNDIAYSKALIEAVDLEKSSRAPKLAIAESVEPWIRRQLSSYGHVQWSPHYDALLQDSDDGRLFVNYLDVVFEHYNDLEIDYGLLAAHKETVANGLMEHEDKEDVLWKYRWLATYHNYACRTFAERFPFPSHEDADPEYSDLCALAQHALDYLVPCEELPPPRPLNPQLLLRQ